ncbi:hypothetical protein OH738_40055 [Streptomyces hirsutus]|uniref:Uncharacterized protein n=1 Tax=Streptomyces hirsutus TaxID=35620 RepID=A0ABZ1GYA8_9ACTN|nr:hypothetical protein [Streptomyces hirsutus]WSD11203.1 hypothetical protein OIE73_39830 [Streptomyces hirsutus]WTD15442.1 hypothetical protein OH738_00125 [Streptomyces hirsutus]WTD22313.1 hypothetical protein OH738_40055 [Streptomyces hirsutus]
MVDGELTLLVLVVLVVFGGQILKGRGRPGPVHLWRHLHGLAVVERRQ